MTHSTTMSLFCQWLLNEADRKHPTTAIVLHGSATHVGDHLVNEIAGYLNEYDEEADGLWLNATHELVLKVAADPSSRRLLGLDDLAPDQATDTPEQYLKTLQMLGSRGHLVYQAPDGGLGAPECGRSFHAGIGTKGQTFKARCHITLDPELIGPACIAPILADVFLEWAHCDERSTRTGIQPVR
jgi:hypothetical protein